MLKSLSRDPRLPRTEESGTRGTDKRWWIVGLLFLGILINYIDRGNLSIAAVPIMRELHLSTSMTGVTLSAFFWTYLVFQIPAGYFVDKAGLRLSYGISFLIWTLSSVAVGLVHSVSGLISLRLLLGMGESVAAPASLAYIKRNFHGEEQGLPECLLSIRHDPWAGGWGLPGWHSARTSRVAIAICPYWPGQHDLAVALVAYGPR